LSTYYDAFPAEGKAVDALHLITPQRRTGHRTFEGLGCGCDVFHAANLSPLPAAHLPKLLLMLSTSNPHHDALLCLTSNDRFDLDFRKHCVLLTLLILAYQLIAIKACARSSEYLRNIVVLLYIQRSS
jgi:hypothetical protein